MKKYKRQSGQTIIEVLIATLVVGLVLTAIANVLTSSIRNTSESSNRSYATSYGQQALEVFRRERALLGWDQFQQLLVAGTFCLEELPADTDAFGSMPQGTCSGAGTVLPGGQFRREALVTIVSPTEVRVEIEVTWYDGPNEKNISMVQEFKEAQLE